MQYTKFSKEERAEVQKLYLLVKDRAKEGPTVLRDALKEEIAAQEAEFKPRKKTGGRDRQRKGGRDRGEA